MLENKSEEKQPIQKPLFSNLKIEVKPEEITKVIEK
jgi:hypothetical protein